MASAVQQRPPRLPSFGKPGRSAGFRLCDHAARWLISRLRHRRASAQSFPRRGIYRFDIRTKGEERLHRPFSLRSKSRMDQSSRFQRSRPDRRHVLERRRADQNGAQQENCSRNRPFAPFRLEWFARAIPAKRERSQGFNPHQQHQSHPRRRQSRTSRSTGCRLRNRLRWNGIRDMTVVAAKSDPPLLSESEFIAGFHGIGEERYHHKHPFHLLMHEGKLTRGQLQAWALNRYFYQSRIPIKDAVILARSEDPAFRLAWRKRILDHDGDGTKPGGIEKWLKLVEATGLGREQALRGDGILP